MHFSSTVNALPSTPFAHGEEDVLSFVVSDAAKWNRRVIPRVRIFAEGRVDIFDSRCAHGADQDFKVGGYVQVLRRLGHKLTSAALYPLIVHRRKPPVQTRRDIRKGVAHESGLGGAVRVVWEKAADSFVGDSQSCARLSSNPRIVLIHYLTTFFNFARGIAHEQSRKGRYAGEGRRTLARHTREKNKIQ